MNGQLIELSLWQIGVAASLVVISGADFRCCCSWGCIGD